MSRLTIYGMGKIGGEVAYLAAVRGLVDEIVIADVVPQYLNAQYLDLIHTGIDVNISTDLSGMGDSDILLFAAGFARTPQIKTRADLLNVNLPVVREFCSRIKNSGFDGTVITVTNPMDALNYFIFRESGLPRGRCLGFGGQLDLARMKIFLKERGLPHDGAWILGEHGEFQVPVFSGIIGGGDGKAFPVSLRDEIQAQMRGASMPVIQGKGGTVFGPAYHISNLIDAVIRDRKEVIPCSCVLDGEYGLHDLSICVPARIGRSGVEEIVERPLDDWENGKFADAARHLKELCGKAE